jgi:hypothetical protein
MELHHSAHIYDHGIAFGMGKYTITYFKHVSGRPVLKWALKKCARVPAGLMYYRIGTYELSKEPLGSI